MHRQMTLWPEPQQPDLETQIWHKFHPDTQRLLITTLARLITKAIHTENIPDPQEVNRESK
jgi:hypothetical protein